MTGLPQQVQCEHCEFVSTYETKRLSKVGVSGAWMCPACSLCNTTEHSDLGFITVLGYTRNLEVEFL